MSARDDMLETLRAEALGRPVKQCPNCSELAAHWIPDRLDDDGFVVKGRYVCEAAP